VARRFTTRARAGNAARHAELRGAPPALIESELFGHEKGPSRAPTPSAGRFEIADQSTLFLDEIGELPLDLQGKLLRTSRTASSSASGQRDVEDPRTADRGDEPEARRRGARGRFRATSGTA